MLGGDFTTIGTTTRKRICRLNPDGSLDATFNPNANGSVLSIVVQQDEKILLGGYFTTIGGTARKHICCLNPDGSLDASFNPNANNRVFSIAVQQDGKILLGGDFTTIGTTIRNCICRIALAIAEEKFSFIEAGVYVDLNFPYVTMNGDFDGRKIYVETWFLGGIGGIRYAVLPKIKGNFGKELSVGWRNENFFGGQISYISSTHDASWLGINMEPLNYTAWGLNVDFPIPISERIKIFLSGGMRLGGFDIKHGEITSLEDIKLQDMSLQFETTELGVGAFYDFTQKISIYGRFCYWWASVTEPLGGNVYTVDQDGSIKDGLKMNGTRFDIGLRYNIFVK